MAVTGAGSKGEEAEGKGAGEWIGAGGSSATALRSGVPTNEETGTLLRLGGKGERLECPSVVPTFLLRAGEGAKDRQGWLLEWLCAGGRVVSRSVTARSTTIDASLRFMKAAGPNESVGVGGIGHLLRERLPQNVLIDSMMSWGSRGPGLGEGTKVRHRG